ncbi:MAG: AAA family ATPase [Oscillospiraceae bacterium]|nr:AAA family ATPase [Oscillospiraceae bacterium]
MEENYNYQNGNTRVHVYTDKDGKPLAEKHIIKQPNGDKKCCWYAIDPQTGTKTKGLNKMELPLYRADVLHNQSINGDENTPIFFAEGEKDVETLEEIFEAIATCTPNGGIAGWKDFYNDDLKKRNIIILTDNDVVGEKYGLTIARNTVSFALSIKIIPAKVIWSSCPEHGDISDIVQALGEDKARELLTDAIQKTEYYFKLGDVDISDFEDLIKDSSEIFPESKLIAKKIYEFEKKPIRYIWYPYIPAGDYTVLMAAGGTGKTYFACGVAATISKGEALPVPSGYEDKQTIPENRNVLIISAEDRGSDIGERLMKAGADENSEYIHIVDKKASNGFLFPKNSEDTSRIKYFEDAIEDYKPNLIIIDPWHAFCPPEVDVNRINHVRPIFQTLSSICEKYDCGLILVSHVNKKPQENANNAALGSVDLINASRSALTVVADSNDKNNRFVVHTKINHAEHGQTIQFKIDDDSFTWNGFEPSITKDTLEDAARMHRKLSEEIKDQPPTDEEIKEELLEIITSLAKQGEETKIAYRQIESMCENEFFFSSLNSIVKRKLIEQVALSEEFKSRGMTLKEYVDSCKYTDNINKSTRYGKGILIIRI